MRSATITLCLLSMTTLVACPPGDDDDSAATGDLSCNFSACGGDIVGTWEVDSTCPNPADPPWNDCNDASTYVVEFDVTATSTFNADGTFSQTWVQSGTTIATPTAACMATLNQTTCAELEANVFGGDATCVAVADGCECTSPAQIVGSVDLEGTYAVSGSDLTLTLDSGPVVAGTYCVDGNVLKTNAPGAPYLSVLVKN